MVAAQVHSLVQEPVQFPTAETPLWVNCTVPVDQIQRYSFIETIQGRVPLENFQNKIVLVGATAATLDSLTTPYNRNPLPMACICKRRLLITYCGITFYTNSRIAG
uniref:CHASE2 domain-containing protein n=1 Tax=Desertifilum tharense IPPAS B-1220 TaxID=1781255 RepID=A0ACD5H1H4_9CYAN